MPATPGGLHRAGNPAANTYADMAIEAALTIRMVFHLPPRQTEGFLRALADMLDVEIPIPDHTTLSRRLKKLGEIRWQRSVGSSNCETIPPTVGRPFETVSLPNAGQFAGSSVCSARWSVI